MLSQNIMPTNHYACLYPEVAKGSDGSIYVVYSYENGISSNEIYYQKIKLAQIDGNYQIKTTSPIRVDSLSNFQEAEAAWPQIAVEANGNINFLFTHRDTNYDLTGPAKNTLLYRYRRD